MALNTTLYVALPIITIFWLIVGGVAPIVVCIVNRGPHRSTIATMLVTIAVCCYVFWLLAFLVQYRPLFGPEVKDGTAAHIRRAWGDQKGYDGDTIEYPCYPAW